MSDPSNYSEYSDSGDSNNSSDWSNEYMHAELVGAGRIKSQSFEIGFTEDKWFLQGSATRIEWGLAKAISRRTGIPPIYLTITFFEYGDFGYEDEDEDEVEGKWVEYVTFPLGSDTRVRALIKPEYVAQVENMYEVWQEDIFKMKTDTDTADFVLTTKNGSKKFPVHKAILSNRSHVFKVMITSDMAEVAAGQAIIEDLDEETLEELIHFLYTGGLSGSQYDIKSLCYAAKKYELDSLMNLVRLHMMSAELDVNHLADLFIASEMFSQEGLFEVAKEKLRIGKWDKGMKVEDVLEKIKNRPELTNKICLCEDLMEKW